MTNFELSYLINNLYYDFSKRVFDNIVLTHLGYYKENNILELIHMMEFIEILEKYSINYPNMNTLTKDEMNEIIVGLNIVNNKNYNLTF